MSNFNFTKPFAFGHRGYSSLATENTLPAFQLLLDKRIQGVELDIRCCASGEIVVIHDAATKRVFNENMEIKNTDLSVLKTLTVKEKYKFPNSISGIPMLTEVFDLLGKDMLYDIEIKSKKIKNPQFILELINLIDLYNLRNQVLVSSFNPFCVRDSRKAGIRNTALIYSSDKEAPFYLRKGEGRIIAKSPIVKPDHRDLGKLWNKKEIKKRPESIICWTVDDTDIVKKLSALGINAFISNKPGEIF